MLKISFETIFLQDLQNCQDKKIGDVLKEFICEFNLITHVTQYYNFSYFQVVFIAAHLFTSPNI